MSSVTVTLDLPEDWADFKLPPALDARLADLLDKQDQSGTLTDSERHEAEALCKLVDMLALLKIRSERVSNDSRP